MNDLVTEKNHFASPYKFLSFHGPTGPLRREAADRSDRDAFNRLVMNLRTIPLARLTGVLRSDSFFVETNAFGRSRTLHTESSNFGD